MKKKRIYFEGNKGKYCVVHLFKTRKELNKWYRENDRTAKEEVYGVSIHREIYKAKDKMIPKNIFPETGKVLLSLQNCGTGVVSHEIMHQVLWSYKHGKRPIKDYPFTIKSMKHEEEILHRFSKVIIDFYRWYWKVEKSFD